jgi:hypothetical protein
MALIALLSVPGLCQRPQTATEGFGINIHFTDPSPGEMDRLAEGGFGFIRMDFAWAGIETKRGIYDFSAYDRLINELEKIDTRALFILDYGNDLYEKGAPRSAKARAAFARFAAASVKHFAGKHVLWEIWNEPNIDFWKPKPNANEYATLAIETAQAIHKSDPSAFVLGPGSSTFPWEYLETIFRAGLLNYIDGVSVHPYRGQEPETAAADFARLRMLIGRYAPPEKRNMPMISSEWGYSTVRPNGVSEETQAQHLPRMWLANLASGVDISIFYDWKNDGPNPEENEHNFGTVHPDLSPKPAFLAAKNLISALRGYSFRHRLAGKTPTDWELLFQRGNSRELLTVSWDAAPTATAERQTPTVRKIEETDTDFPGLLHLTAIRFPYGVLTEGMGQYATLRVAFANSGEEPEKYSLKVISPSFPSVENTLSATLPPGHQTVSTVTLPLADHRQDSDPIILEAKWNDTPLPALAPIIVKRTDPLQITTAPAGKDLVVTVENPAESDFKGKVQLMGPNASLASKTIQMGWRGFGITGVPQNPLPQRPEDQNPSVSFDFKTLTARPLLPADHATVTFPLTLNAPLSIRVVDESGQEVALSPVHRYIPFEGFTGAAGTLTWRRVDYIDNKEQSPTPLSFVATPRNSPVPTALRFDYTFDKGWRYTQAKPATPLSIPEKATALTLWVFSDGSGDALRSRFQDSTGQTFQVDLGTLAWKGWRPVTIPLDGSGSGISWGGANDKVPHAPLHWDGLVLIDSIHREQAHGGTILLAAPTYTIE